MRKKIILLFTLIVLGFTATLIGFFQSARFASFIKQTGLQYLPQDLGVTGDFEHLSMQLFPPGISIVNPRLKVLPKNVLDLPPGTEIETDEIRLHFRPFQMLSGQVLLHEVHVVNGHLKTAIITKENAPRKKKSNIHFSWEDLVNIKVERVVLENVQVDLDLPEIPASTHFNAKLVEVGQTYYRSGVAYEVYTYLDKLSIKPPKSWLYPTELDSLRLNAFVSSEGLEVREWEIIREGTQAVANGKIQGDLFKGSGLKADLEMKLQGDLAPMLQFLSKNKKEDLPQGHITFVGNAKADLDRPQETLNAQGFFKGENIRFKDYNFEKVEIDGGYKANGELGEFRVKKATIESREIQKQGGFQAGSGGKIELGGFEYRMGSVDPIETTLSLQNAHLHWLGAALLDDLYALEGRVSGDAKLKFKPQNEKEEWKLSAEIDWKVSPLQLDNQRLKKNKPLSRLFRIESANLKGGVEVKAAGISFQNLQAQIKDTDLKVEGGIKLLPKTVYDIRGGGPVNLSEFGVLAENKILGKGQMSVHVHGSYDKLFMDFDSDVRDFEYLNLKFGQIRGRITWDDSPQLIRFNEIDCNKGQTRYRVYGTIDVSDRDQLNLHAKILDGNFDEFSSVFEELTKDYSWYPKSLIGAMTGEIRVTGGISLSQMLIDADIDGQNWEYWGERFRNVKLKGGYDKGKFQITSFEAQKRQGKILGRISYDTKNIFDWNIRTQDFLLSDFDQVSRLDVPVRGEFNVSSQGKGPQGNVEAQTTVNIQNFVVRGRPMESSQLKITSKQGKTLFAGNAMGDQGQFELHYDFDNGKPSELKMKANNLDFTPILLLLNPSLIRDEKLSGKISGTYQLSFLTGRAEYGSGFASLKEYALQKDGVRFKLDHAVEFKIEKGSFRMPPLTIVGEEGKVTVNLKSDLGEVDGSVHAKIDLALAEFFTPAISQARGLLVFDGNFSGPLKQLKLSGDGRIENGLLRLAALETPVERINGPFQIKNWDIQIKNIDGDLAGGRTTVDGNVDLYLDQLPKINLNLGLNGNKLKVYPFQVAKVRGKLNAHGNTLPYLVEGKVFVDSALSREKISSSRSQGVRSALYTPDVNTLSLGEISLFKLNIAVSAVGNVIVQNELLDVEAKGDLQIVGTIDNPRPLGKAQSIQGKLLFKDRVFQIQSGIVEFDNPTTINPKFDLSAVTELNNRKIQMYASGRFDKMKIEFNSNPPMSENEILSFLALGTTNEDLQKMRNVNQSAYQQGEAASLVLHSLDFNREVQNKTGFQINVDQSIDPTTGVSAFTRSSDGTTNAASPKIVIKRSIGKRVDISAGSTVGVGQNTQRQVNAELKVTNGFSVIGVWDTFEGANTADRNKSYGVDVKLQKRFK